VDSITCGSQPHFIAKTSDGETVVVVNTGSDELTYFYPNGDPEDNVFNVKLDPDDPAPLGQPELSPYCIAIAHDDSLAYVCCRKSKWEGQSAVFVVDIKRRLTLDTILVPFVNRSGLSTNYHMGLCILIDDDQYLAFTTQDGNSVVLLDLSDGTFEEAVVQHNVTFGITANSDEDHLYATASNANLLSTPGWVYEFEREGGSLTVLDSVEVGLWPNGLHVKPGAHTHEH
jgi:6-phosphogluconolactonase (cycloisomerase 2 family)